MALARPGLRSERGLLFWKLCGAGSGHGFAFRPDGRVWAILASWASEAAARSGIEGATWRGWRERAAESWTTLLSPLSVRGAWAGVNPFLPDPGATGSGPFAVLTRATLRPRHLPHFWRAVPEVNDRIGMDPEVLFKIGIGEVPLLHQVTFSIWPDLGAMTRFARAEDGPHARAIRAARQGGWFSEELYARFQVMDSLGSWNGGNPLPAPPASERIRS